MAKNLPGIRGWVDFCRHATDVECKVRNLQKIFSDKHGLLKHILGSLTHLLFHLLVSVILILISRSGLQSHAMIIVRFMAALVGMTMF